MPEPIPGRPGAPFVADGGLGTLLEDMGVDVRGPSWSAAALHDDPDAIRAAHLAFFEAGADLAVTASYQVCFDGPASAGASRDEIVAALAASVRLAEEAARAVEDADGRRRGVWASVGPYGASLADGSEYSGAYGLTVAQLRAWHRPRLLALADAGATAFAVETIPSAAEAEAVLLELADLGIPSWLTMTADGDRTRTGEPLREVFSIAAEVGAVGAVGANCCDRAGVDGALAAAAAVAPALALVAKPNGPGVWDAAARAWRAEAEPVDPFAGLPGWLDAGAAIVGGCCRVTPAHIRALRAAVDAAA